MITNLQAAELQQSNKLFDGQVRLNNDGFERFRRQLAVMAGNNNMKMSLLGVTEIGMAYPFDDEYKSQLGQELAITFEN